MSVALLLFGGASDYSLSQPVGPLTAKVQEIELTVALDHRAYRLRELYLLEDVIRKAAASRQDGVSIGRADGVVIATVWDANRNGETIALLRKAASERSMSIDIIPAKAFWVRLSDNGAEEPSVKWLEEQSRWEGSIQSLRTALPGVEVRQDGDAATVQADDSGFGTTLSKMLNGVFLITQLTPTSWRVSLNTKFLPQGFSVEKQQAMVSKTAEAVRLYLGDPLELQVYAGGDPDHSGGRGAHFLVRDPARHAPFIEAVRKAFDQDRLFIFSEIDAREVRFIGSDSKRQSGEEFDLELMDAVHFALAPQEKLRIEDDGVTVEAEDAARNGELASIVQQALAGRSDLALKPRPNARLRVELAAEGHLGAAAPKLSASDFLKSVTARLEAAEVEPKRLVPLDSERVQIVFTTQTEADKLRAAILKPSGLTIRMVEERPDAATKPTPGYTSLKLPTGEDIWVAPQAIVTGDMIADAEVMENEFTQQPMIQFRLNDEGRSLFAAATRRHVGKRFAIVVNDAAVTAPVIQTPILGGTAQITGNFTADSANDLLKSILPHRGELLLTLE